MSVECHECGKEYTNKGIGHHWRQSSCSYPVPSIRQKEIFTGLLMSDATIQDTGSYPMMRIGMTNRLFLEWLEKELGLLCSSLVLKKTAEDSARHARKTGFRPKAKTKNYRDVYALTTRSLPFFERLLEWYSTGEKVFPEIKLTPTIVKMWYCGDGNLAVRREENYQHYAQITCSNEKDRMGKLQKMFNQAGFDPSISKNDGRLSFSNKETKELLSWMGDPPPGFKYKWEIDNYEKYIELKHRVYKD